MLFRLRQAALAALTANAVRPLPGFRGRDPLLLRRRAHRRARPAPAGPDRSPTPPSTCPPAPAPGTSRPGSRWPRASTVGLGLLDRPEPPGAPSTSRTRWSRASASTTSSSSTRRPPPPTWPPRGASWSTRSGCRTRASRSTSDIAYADARAARPSSTSTGPPSASPSSAPVLLQVHGGGWIGREQGPAGHPPDAAHGREGLGVRRDQLPARRRATPCRRTSSTSSGRSPGSSEHIAEYGGDPDYVAITGGSAGGHLAALAALTPDDPDVAARLRGGRHRGAGRRSRTTASTTSPGRTGTAQRDRGCATCFLAPAGHADDAGATTPSASRPPPRSCGSRRRPRLLRHPRRPRHAGRGRARPGFRRRAAPRSRRSRSCTPSCPAPSTPSTSSPRSARAHVVRGHRPLPALALEHLARRAGGGAGARLRCARRAAGRRLGAAVVAAERAGEVLGRRPAAGRTGQRQPGGAACRPRWAVVRRSPGRCRARSSGVPRSAGSVRSLMPRT